MNNIYEQFKDTKLTDEQKSELLSELDDKQLKNLYKDCEYPIFQDSVSEEEDSLYIFISFWIEENKGEEYLFSL